MGLPRSTYYDAPPVKTDDADECRDLCFVLLKKIGRAGILIKGPSLKLLDPDSDQVARDVVAFGETVECLARNEVQGDLSFELDAMDAVLGHGFHPLKARQRRSIPNLQTVHRHGRIPPERSTGFCLVDAPDAETAACVHREAHGQIASDIIAVDLAAVEAFLGRISDPRNAPDATAPEMGAGLRAVMFTDIVGSTEMTARLGDAAALELVRVHNALVRRGLASHHGREVKHTGDGIMAAFDDVADSVRAAADIQRRFASYNADASESLRVRIGIHAGEPVADRNDLFGATVQLAHRLCSEAEADGVIVSGLVRELSDEDKALFVALGERRLKGFTERTPVFRFEWRGKCQAELSDGAIVDPKRTARRAKY